MASQLISTSPLLGAQAALHYRQNSPLWDESTYQIALNNGNSENYFNALQILGKKYKTKDELYAGTNTDIHWTSPNEYYDLLMLKYYGEVGLNKDEKIKYETYQYDNGQIKTKFDPIEKMVVPDLIEKEGTRAEMMLDQFNANMLMKKAQWQHDEAERIKANMNNFYKTIANIGTVTYELVDSIADMADGITSAVYGLGAGIAGAIQGKDFAESMASAIASDDARFMKQAKDWLGITQWAEDFERLSAFKDTDGNLNTAGSWVFGIVNTLGQIVIPALITHGVSLAGAPTWLSEIVSTTTFYSAFFANNVQETYNEAAKYGASVSASEILGKAALEAAGEVAIEKSLDFLIGASPIDNIAFGAKSGTKSLLTNTLAKTSNKFARAGLIVGTGALKEGVEEGLQEMWDGIVQYGFAACNSNMELFKTFTWSDVVQSAVIGSICSLVGSAGKFIKAATIGNIQTSEVKLDKNGKAVYDKDGNPVYKKLGALNSFLYEASLEHYGENLTEINKAVKNANKIEKLYRAGKITSEERDNAVESVRVAAQTAYAATRILADLMGEIGEKQFTKVGEFLKALDDTANANKGMGEYSDGLSVDSIRQNKDGSVAYTVTSAGGEYKNEFTIDRKTLRSYISGPDEFERDLYYDTRAKLRDEKPLTESDFNILKLPIQSRHASIVKHMMENGKVTDYHQAFSKATVDAYEALTGFLPKNVKKSQLRLLQRIEEKNITVDEEGPTVVTKENIEEQDFTKEQLATFEGILNGTLETDSNVQRRISPPRQIVITKTGEPMWVKTETLVVGKNETSKYKVQGYVNEYAEQSLVEAIINNDIPKAPFKKILIEYRTYKPAFTKDKSDTEIATAAALSMIYDGTFMRQIFANNTEGTYQLYLMISNALTKGNKKIVDEQKLSPVERGIIKGKLDTIAKNIHNEIYNYAELNPFAQLVPGILTKEEIKEIRNKAALYFVAYNIENVKEFFDFYKKVATILPEKIKRRFDNRLDYQNFAKQSKTTQNNEFIKLRADLINALYQYYYDTLEYAPEIVPTNMVLNRFLRNKNITLQTWLDSNYLTADEKEYIITNENYMDQYFKNRDREKTINEDGEIITLSLRDNERISIYQDTVRNKIPIDLIVKLRVEQFNNQYKGYSLILTDTGKFNVIYDNFVSLDTEDKFDIITNKLYSPAIKEYTFYEENYENLSSLVKPNLNLDYSLITVDTLIRYPELLNDKVRNYIAFVNNVSPDSITSNMVVDWFNDLCNSREFDYPTTLALNMYGQYKLIKTYDKHFMRPFYWANSKPTITKSITSSGYRLTYKIGDLINSDAVPELIKNTEITFQFDERVNGFRLIKETENSKIYRAGNRTVEIDRNGKMRGYYSDGAGFAVKNDDGLYSIYISLYAIPTGSTSMAEVIGEKTNVSQIMGGTDTLNTAIHEITHIFQRYYGFAEGGSDALIPLEMIKDARKYLKIPETVSDYSVRYLLYISLRGELIANGFTSINAFNGMVPILYDENRECLIAPWGKTYSKPRFKTIPYAATIRDWLNEQNILGNTVLHYKDDTNLLGINHLFITSSTIKISNSINASLRDAFYKGYIIGNVKRAFNILCYKTDAGDIQRILLSGDIAADSDYIASVFKSDKELEFCIYRTLELDVNPNTKISDIITESIVEFPDSNFGYNTVTLNRLNASAINFAKKEVASERVNLYAGQAEYRTNIQRRESRQGQLTREREEKQKETVKEAQDYKTLIDTSIANAETKTLSDAERKSTETRLQTLEKTQTEFAKYNELRDKLKEVKEKLKKAEADKASTIVDALTKIKDEMTNAVKNFETKYKNITNKSDYEERIKLSIIKAKIKLGTYDITKDAKYKRAEQILKVDKLYNAETPFGKKPNLTKKEVEGTRLEPFYKKGTGAQLNPKIQSFVANLDVNHVDKKTGEVVDDEIRQLILSREITWKDLLTRIRKIGTGKYLDNYTYKMLISTIPEFKNLFITSQNTLKYLINTIDFLWYIAREFKKNNNTDILDKVVTTKRLSELIDKIKQSGVHESKVEKAFQTVSDTEGKLMQVDINYEDLVLRLMREYDGTLGSLYRIGQQVRNVSARQKEGKYKTAGEGKRGGSLDEQLGEEDERTKGEFIKDPQNVEEIVALSNDYAPIERKKWTLVNNTFDELNTLAIAEHSKKVEFQGKTYYIDSDLYNAVLDYYDKMPLEEINTRYALVTNAEASGIDINAVEIPKEIAGIEREPSNVVRSIRNIWSRISTSLRNLSNKTLLNRIIKENSDILNEDGSLKMELLRTLDAKKNVKSYAKLSTLVKIEDRLSVIFDDLKNALKTKATEYDNLTLLKEQIASIENELIAKQMALKEKDKALEEEKRKLFAADERIHELEIELGKHKNVTFTYKGSENVTMPSTLRDIITTEVGAGDLVKTHVQGISTENDFHKLASEKDFFERNAETLNTLGQTEINEIIDFYANTTDDMMVAEDANTNYKWVRLALFLYISDLAQRDIIELTEEQRQIMAGKIQKSATESAQVLSLLSRFRFEFSPEEVIIKRILRNNHIAYDPEKVKRLVQTSENIQRRMSKLLVDKPNISESELDEITRNELQILKDTYNDLYNDVIAKNKNKSVSFFEKLITVQRLAMLSALGTALRNKFSNVVLTIVNKASDSIGESLRKIGLISKQIEKAENYIPLDKDGKPIGKRKQYKLVGVKIDERAKKLSESVVLDELYKMTSDGLLKQDTKKISENKGGTIADMIKDAIESKLTRDGQVKTKVFKKWQEIIYKAMSDDKYVKRKFKEYFAILLSQRVDEIKNDAQIEEAIYIDPKKKDVAIDNIVQEVFVDAYILAANDYQHQANFISKMEGAIWKYGGTGAYFMYKQLLPFGAASWNWYLEGLRLSPLGLAKAIYDLIRIEKTIDRMDSQHEKYRGQYVDGQFAVALTLRNIGKGLIGTFMWTVGAILAAMGLARIDDDDDKVKLRLFDKIDIDISSITGTSGLLMGMAMFNKDDDTFMKGFKHTANTLLDEMFLTQIQSALKGDSIAQWLQSFFVNEFRMFIPSIVRNVGQTIYPYKPAYSSNIIISTAEKWLNYLGMNWALSPLIDPYTGEKVSRVNAPSYGGSMALMAINTNTPIKLKFWTMSKQEREARGVGVNRSQITLDTKKFWALNGKEKSELNEIYGLLNNTTLTAIINNKIKVKVYNEKRKTYETLYYSQMTNEQKKNAISTAMTNNAQYAKIQFLTSTGKYKYYATDGMYEKLKKLGITKNVYRKTNKLEGFVN